MIDQPKIGVVGPCAAGKTTLITYLRRLGINIHHIAQEHSYVKDMWRRVSNPDILIYLDVSYPVSYQRRQMDWTEDDYRKQVARLEHARQHADFILDTSDLTIEEVRTRVLEYLTKQLGQSLRSAV